MRQGWLSEAHTTLRWNPEHWLAKFLPRGLVRELSRRQFPSSVQPYLRLHRGWELLRLMYHHSFLHRFPGAVESSLGTRAVVRRLDAATSRRVGRLSGLKAVYCYEDLALQTFREARARGVTTIYELPTPHWRTKMRLIEEDAVLLPQWACTLPINNDSPECLVRKDAEIQLADHIIVPSEFVRDSLKEAPPFQARIHVIPYGAPGAAQSPEGSHVNPTPGTLRVLYVGNLGQAKGIGYLHEAFLGLGGNIKLTVIGGRVSKSFCAPLEAMLSRHDYRGRMPNSEVLKLMPHFDVLVAPTLFEGLSLVLLEAMSRGLTVITTPHSGITGLIEDGKDGFVVPIRDSRAIADRLKLLADDAGLLQRMKTAAWNLAQTFSAERYQERLRICIETVLDQASRGVVPDGDPRKAGNQFPITR